MYHFGQISYFRSNFLRRAFLSRVRSTKSKKFHLILCNIQSNFLLSLIFRSNFFISVKFFDFRATFLPNSLPHFTVGSFSNLFIKDQSCIIDFISFQVQYGFTRGHRFQLHLLLLLWRGGNLRVHRGLRLFHWNPRWRWKRALRCSGRFRVLARF